MREAFNNFYDDFKQCIPPLCRDILALDGRMNVAAHFPKNGLGPDLGALANMGRCSHALTIIC